LDIVKNSPLVSIIVITYNSAKYVLDTLESAKAQTYQNIELIVSDDGSKDDTVQVCRDWIGQNEARFVKTQIITTVKNTGIPSNCNRGVKAATGEWIKLIAGDDILFNHCVEDNLLAIMPDDVMVLSELEDFEGNESIDVSSRKVGVAVNPIFKALKDARSQFLYFLKGYYIPGSAIFVQRQFINEIGGYDERYNLVEDRPLFLKMTYHHYLIKYIDWITVGHRRHDEGITATMQDRIVHPYVGQVYAAIYENAKMSKAYFYKFNVKWHLVILNIIFRFGNKGRLLYILNKIRMIGEPLRLWEMVTKNGS
jgi:glycosyltransferase involved in cell wall biosynthesis